MGYLFDNHHMAAPEMEAHISSFKSSGSERCSYDENHIEK
jgi:hypothetical protein